MSVVLLVTQDGVEGLLQFWLRRHELLQGSMQGGSRMQICELRREPEYVWEERILQDHEKLGAWCNWKLGPLDLSEANRS